jgi:hypothetical protein
MLEQHRTQVAVIGDDDVINIISHGFLPSQALRD